MAWAAAALLCAGAQAVDAVPAGCERVAQASIATVSAPRYHQRNTGGGADMELLRIDGKVWQRVGTEGWKVSRMGPAAFERAAHQAGSVLARCERVGSERIEGVATEVWRVTTRVLGGQPATTSQMWIGAGDGRTYRNSGAGIEATVRYQGVEAPL